MPASVLVLKSCQHSTLSWSNVNSSFVPTFTFVIKLPRHFICIEATSTLQTCRNCDNIHLCHEATTTLHLYWGHANIASLLLKLRQHSIFAEAMPTFIFAMKPRQHFTYTEAMPTLHLCHWSYVNTPFLPKPCQRSSLPWSHDNTSPIPRPCQHCNFAIETTSTLHLPKLWQHSWSHVKTSFA